jgi:hypothetical protein
MTKIKQSSKYVTNTHPLLHVIGGSDIFYLVPKYSIDTGYSWRSHATYSCDKARSHTNLLTSSCGIQHLLQLAGLH